MPTHLLVATGNAHKLAEYAQLLNMPMLTLCSLRDVAISADAPEDGTTFVANALRLLLANVNALGDVVRSARFVCVIALVLPDGREFHTQGICEGQIAMHEAGDEGFGYDPIFWLPERQCTIAQLSAAQKHAISHRGQATRAMHAILQGLEP
ncbi:MAG: non-canonical purine NTP pyrophosphatase [Chloroflexaceae bacterium]|nr:non-canonical purine NTP pyrophosphatase [Chloroflexaceae bacterium]